MTRKERGVLLLLVALCAIVAIASPQFLSVTNLQNVARLVGTYGMFSIGVGIVIITGGIDLSVGSICALLGVLRYSVIIRSISSSIFRFSSRFWASKSWTDFSNTRS